MGILTNFGQSLSYTTSNGTLDDAMAAAFILAILLVSLIAGVILYLVIALSLMQIFKKAGVKQWIAWIPYYNSWKMLEIGGQPGFWAILGVVPVISIVTLVYTYIAMYHIGKKLGKDDSFMILAIFLPLVWYIWLAVDKSKWHDKASSAPSLAK